MWICLNNTYQAKVANKYQQDEDTRIPRFILKFGMEIHNNNNNNSPVF